MIQDTSLWEYARAAQNVGAKQKEVLDVVRLFPDAMNAEIGAYLKWRVDRITPRCLELRKMGLVRQRLHAGCRVKKWDAFH